MSLYFALFRLPSWQALSRAQRRFVLGQCAHPLLLILPIPLAITFLGLISVVAACSIGQFFHLGSAVIPILFAPELLDFCLIARYRRDIDAFIQSNGAEIQSVV